MSFYFKTVLSFIAFLAMPYSLHASVQLNSGLTHEYNVSAGQRVSGVFELTNMSGELAELKIYQGDAKNRSNKSWIRLSTDRVSLSPGATRKVNYTVSVPSGASKGSHWSYVYLEPVSNKSRESQIKQPTDGKSFVVGVRSKIRYAVNIMTHLEGGYSNLVFSNPKIKKNSRGQKGFSIDINNSGSQYSRPVITMEIFNNSGSPIKSLKGESQSVFPGQSTSFFIPLQGVSSGSYKALFVAEDQRQGKTFGSDVNLTVKP